MGADGIEKAKEDYYDLILLDVGLPDMDGREVCRLMRRGGVKSPIIMLTAAESDADTILALDAGANDYVTKPFRLGVLLARMRAQLRQHEQSEDRSEEHTSELQALMRISYAVFCLKKKNQYE